MRVMSSVGSPTEVRTITIVTKPAWGMPAAPILAAVAVILDWMQRQTDQTKPAAVCFYCPHNKNIQPYGDDLTKVHLHVVDLSNEDGCQCFVQSCPIHVDGGTHRQHKACDSLINSVVFLQTFKGDREGGWAGMSKGKKTLKCLPFQINDLKIPKNESFCLHHMKCSQTSI